MTRKVGPTPRARYPGSQGFKQQVSLMHQMSVSGQVRTNAMCIYPELTVDPRAALRFAQGLMCFQIKDPFLTRVSFRQMRRAQSGAQESHRAALTSDR